MKTILFVFVSVVIGALAGVGGTLALNKTPTPDPEIKTVYLSPSPSPKITITPEAKSEQDKVVAAANAYLAAQVDNKSALVTAKDVKIQGEYAFAAVKDKAGSAAGGATAILKKAGTSWVVLFVGNGNVPVDLTTRFAIPKQQ